MFTSKQMKLTEVQYNLSQVQKATLLYTHNHSEQPQRHWQNGMQESGTKYNHVACNTGIKPNNTVDKCSFKTPLTFLSDWTSGHFVFYCLHTANYLLNIFSFQDTVTYT